MSGASFYLLRHLMRWYETQGLEAGVARALVAETFRGNAEVFLQSDAGLDAIADGVTTKGGITAQLVGVLEAERRAGGLGSGDGCGVGADGAGAVSGSAHPRRRPGSSPGRRGMRGFGSWHGFAQLKTSPPSRSRNATTSSMPLPWRSCAST